MTNLFKQAKRSVEYWWMYLLLGIVLIIGAIWVFKTPVESYITLAVFLSILVFINGIGDVIFSIKNHKILSGWGWYLAGGILEILMGVFLMNYPQVTMIVLPIILGFWLMYGAVSTISASFDLKSYHVEGWGWILFTGIMLMIFSFMVLIDPIFGSGAIVVYTGIAILLYGVGYIIIALKLRKVKVFVGDAKKAVKEGLDDLKNQVLAAIKNASDDTSASADVEEKFEDYRNTLD